MAEKKKGFDLAAVLSDVSKLDTNREQIEYIDIDLLDADPNNFYELSEIDALAANIELIGLQQPLRVRTSTEDPARVVIVSGHRRREAIRKLVADGRDDLREVACIREQPAASGALQELRLIYANSDTRCMSSADLNKQAARVEALLYQLKEEGYEFPGRMRDHVAEACKVSKTKLARLKMIRDNLLKEWKNFYEKGDLVESAAYALAKLPTVHQIAIFNYRNSSKENPAKWFHESTIENYRQHLAKIDALTCKKCEGAHCSNSANKYQKMMSVDYSWKRDRCGKCCSACKDLAKCKFSCPLLAEKVKKLKADAKAARQQEKTAAEERERPKIEQLQKLWYRFGVARETAGKSVEDTFNAASMYYTKDQDKKYAELEGLWGKFTTYTNLPYGYQFRIDEANKLIRMADLLGCSLDYLFCRTDDPGCMGAPASGKAEAAASSAEILPATWYPASVEPPACSKIITIGNDGFVEDCYYMGGGVLSEHSVTLWSEVSMWSMMPAEASTPAPAIPGWKPGTENPVESTNAVAVFDLDGKSTIRRLAHWTGFRWQFTNGAAIETKCIKWYPIPDDKEDSNVL